MRVNTSNNHESCVWFCFLTGPCLQSNLELHTKWNKTGILNLRNGWSENKWASHINECWLGNTFKYDSLILASVQLIFLFGGACKHLIFWGGCFSVQGLGRCSHHHLYKWWVIVDGQASLEEKKEKGFYCGLLPCWVVWGLRQAPWA